MNIEVNEEGTMFRVSAWREDQAWLRCLPGMVVDRAKTHSFYFPITFPVCDALYQKGSATPDAFKIIERRVLAQANAKDAIDGLSEDPVLPAWFRRKLMPHQSRALAAIDLLGHRMLLADDMGLGKTTVAIASHVISQAERCVVVCPASVKYNWAHELKECLGVDIWDQVMVIDGAKKKRETIFKRIESSDVQFLIINYDLLRVLTKEQMGVLESHVAGNGTLILDESHYVKDCNSARTKACADLAEAAMGVLLLTGTPIRNMADDYYSQLRMIAPIWRNKWEFEDRYMLKNQINARGGRKVFKIVGTKNEAALNKVVDFYQVRRMKEDVIDLPPKMPPTPVGIDLDPVHERIYKAMKSDWAYEFASLPDDTLVLSKRAENAMTAILRCEQIAQGFIGGMHPDLANKLGKTVDTAEPIPGRDRELFFPKHPKVIWLIETLESLLLNEKSPCVWFKFNAPLLWFAAALPRLIPTARPIALHGALSSEQKEKAVSDFQEGVGNIFLGQVKMAEGFNLTKSQDVIFYGRDWSPAINKQAEDRVYRIGQTGTVNIWLPTVTDTIESYINARLREKAESAENVMSGLTVGELRGML